MAETINMLVVGECGDGKSTLINNLRDHEQSIEPICGKNPEGVTKEIVLYRCPDLDGKPFNLIDTPGVGDGTVTPVALIALLEEFLKSDMVPGGIRGVIVTTPIPDCRIKLGAQVVQIIVDKGFVAGEGEDKYANIILTGTKADKADDEEKGNFMEGVDGDKSVRELFFKLAVPPGKGPAVMVSKQDYTPLIGAIKLLPVVSILYKAPEAKVMANALAEKLGMEAEEFEEQIAGMRELVQQQSAQIQALMQQMHDANQQHREEMRLRDEQMADLQRQIIEERRRADLERQAREREYEQRRKEEREEARRERQLEQERWEAATREMQQSQEQMLNQIRQQAAAEQRRHQQAMRQMQAESQTSFRQAVQKASTSSSSGGGGKKKKCFPGSAVVETPQGPKLMTDLRAGDEVLAVAASGEFFFDEVYFFGHASPDERSPYVWLCTASGKALRASPRHMVPVFPRGEGDSAGRAGWRGASHRYADSVQVGDELWVRGATGDLAREAVLEVASGTGKGAFNPFTFSGTLLVDGVVASVHSEWLLDDIVPTSWVPSLPSIYQALLLPGRGLYRLLGASAADVLEVNSPQGEWNEAIGTSRRAFAFFVASHLLPAAALAAAVAQRFTLE